jgi:hypothetical protein
VNTKNTPQTVSGKLKITANENNAVNESQAPPSHLGNNGAFDEITDKKGFARHWFSTVRSCDNWLARGLPHYKLSARRVRIRISEGDSWMRSQFGTRRIGPANQKIGGGL